MGDFGGERGDLCKHIEAFRRGDPPGALEDYDHEAQRLTDLGAGAAHAVLTERKIARVTFLTDSNPHTSLPLRTAMKKGLRGA